MKPSTAIFLVIVLGITGTIGWSIYDRLNEEQGSSRSESKRGPVPVEVAPIEVGAIERTRTFSGTLEAPARFVVAPKVGGRLESLAVDLADEVQRGQVVAHLDNAEFLQAIARAEAELAVARARLTEASSSLEIATRTLERSRSLREQEVTSEAELDVAIADHLAKSAAVAVAEAEVTRDEAALETARIRLGYTKVTADWNEGDDTRVVGMRFIDEGDTVAANASLMSIVELDPLEAVIFATERDYSRLHIDQRAELRTDAFPDETFDGVIARIAPVFRRESRQARVELTVDNADGRLKPGMFVRARVVLEVAEDVTIVPYAAIATRENRNVLFVLPDGADTVRMQPVEVGIREGERVEVRGEGLTGRVVTLGQQLLGPDSRVTVPDREVRSSNDGSENDNPTAGLAGSPSRE